MFKKLIPAGVAALLAMNILSGFQKTGDAAKGKELFEQCGVCHNADSEEKKMGPGLKGLYKKAKMNNGKKPSDETVLGVINAGGNGMPAYDSILSDEEKKHLLAYLKTL
jgi:mono/diheme cytochrome c family protein